MFSTHTHKHITQAHRHTDTQVRRCAGGAGAQVHGHKTACGIGMMMGRRRGRCRGVGMWARHMLFVVAMPVAWSPRSVMCGGGGGGGDSAAVPSPSTGTPESSPALTPGGSPAPTPDGTLPPGPDGGQGACAPSMEGCSGRGQCPDVPDKCVCDDPDQWTGPICAWPIQAVADAATEYSAKLDAGKFQCYSVEVKEGLPWLAVELKSTKGDPDVYGVSRKADGGAFGFDRHYDVAEESPLRDVLLEVSEAGVAREKWVGPWLFCVEAWAGGGDAEFTFRAAASKCPGVEFTSSGFEVCSGKGECKAATWSDLGFACECSEAKLTGVSGGCGASFVQVPKDKERWETSGQVPGNEWSYYEVEVTSEVWELKVTLEPTEGTGPATVEGAVLPADADLALRLGQPPTRTEFDYVSQLAAGYADSVSLSRGANGSEAGGEGRHKPLADGTWYIGAYGFYASDFQLLVEKNACPGGCSHHGECNEAKHTCECDSGWDLLADCSAQVQPLEMLRHDQAREQVDTMTMEPDSYTFFELHVAEGEGSHHVEAVVNLTTVTVGAPTVDYHALWARPALKLDRPASSIADPRKDLADLSWATAAGRGGYEQSVWVVDPGSEFEERLRQDTAAVNAKADEAVAFASIHVPASRLVAGLWRVAVYNPTMDKLKVYLTVERRVYCPNDCNGSNGECNDDGTCTCNGPRYVGADCTRIDSTRSGSGDGWSTSFVLLLSLVSVGLGAALSSNCGGGVGGSGGGAIGAIFGFIGAVIFAGVDWVRGLFSGRRSDSFYPGDNGESYEYLPPQMNDDDL